MPKGFSYVEFLVYFCIFALVIPLLLRSVVGICLRLKQEHTILERKIVLLQALDHIAAQVYTAPADLHWWKSTQPHSFIWHDAEQKIDKGICLIKNDLWYSTGTYGADQQIWHKQHKELLAPACMIACVFHIKKGNYLRGITCTLTSTNPEMTGSFSKIFHPLEEYVSVYE